MQKILSIILISLYVVFRLLPIQTIYNKENSSKAFLDSSNKLIKITLSGDEKYRVYVPLKDIPQDIIDSTLAYEDRYFYYHPGINPFAFLRSILKTIVSGKLHGGSTITMQLARIRFRLKTRTLPGKLNQIFKAILIEAHYTKDQILEAYFNSAPYGGNIEGIGSASLLLLNKTPQELNTNDAIWLSLIPQSPTARNPQKLSGKKKLTIASTRHPGINSAQSYSPLFREEGFRSSADHFIDRIAKSSPIGIITTSLSLEKQNQTMNLFKDYITANDKVGIKNGSIIVVDTTDMSVITYIGSANYYSKNINGYVNGLIAKRSPGSTIKPFIYGLAIDQGIITPDSLLKDTPINISSYVPDNFEKNFFGPINATEALVRSRNIPAISLMNKLKSPSIYDFLKENGVSNLKDPNYYGLALALGGFEISMEELIKLYGSLKNAGEIKNLTFTKESASTKQSRLSSTASFLVLEMLKTNPRPNETYAGSANSSKLPVPWKTGTSFSSKDAWSIGFAGKYLIGVWIGNFDGTSNPNFIGRDVAGPLFFQIADFLSSNEILNYSSSKKPLNLAVQELCALSGQPANDFCPYKKSGFVIPGVSQIRKCSIHRNIPVNSEETLQLCNKDEKGAIFKTYEFLDSDLYKLYELAGLKRKTPPPFSPECATILANKQIQPNHIFVLSPNSNTIYKIDNANNGYADIPFSASTQSNSSQFFWFLDNRLVRTTDTSESFTYKLRAGEYFLKVSDGIISSDEVKIKVEN